MISQEIERKILFYHLHEKWRIGTIARELRVHHETVRRVLAEAGFKKDACLPSKRSMIEPFLPFIRQEIEKHSGLTSARLFAMCVERGYKGSADHFRAMVRRIRPKKEKEVFALLETTMGEQAQVDWGAFGKMPVLNGIRDISAFVMVLSWSRAIYLEFFHDQRVTAFLEGHNNAFRWLGGLPRVILYDNLKSVVIERQGDVIRFNSQFMNYANNLGFEPRPVAVRRGNEKGRVERAIRYIRDNFFAGREFKDLDDLNAQAKTWCETVALARRCRAEPGLSVEQALAMERDLLRKRPNLPVAEELLTMRVPKVPVLRIDSNDYAVPPLCAHKMVVVRLAHHTVKIECDGKLVVEHKRHWGKKVLIDEAGMSKALTSKKPRSFQEAAKLRLIRSLPNFNDYLRSAVEEGYQIGSTVSAICRLLDSYGCESVEKALQEAMVAGQLNTGSVSLILDRERRKKNEEIPLPVSLPDDPRLRNLVVHHHDMEKYNSLMEACDEQ